MQGRNLIVAIAIVQEENAVVPTFRFSTHSSKFEMRDIAL